ncbi:unnamed protein product [Rhizopus stolonifer]
MYKRRPFSKQTKIIINCYLKMVCLTHLSIALIALIATTSAAPCYGGASVAPHPDCQTDYTPFVANQVHDKSLNDKSFDDGKDRVSNDDGDDSCDDDNSDSDGSEKDSDKSGDGDGGLVNLFNHGSVVNGDVKAKNIVNDLIHAHVLGKRGKLVEAFDHGSVIDGDLELKNIVNDLIHAHVLGKRGKLVEAFDHGSVVNGDVKAKNIVNDLIHAHVD